MTPREGTLSGVWLLGPTGLVRDLASHVLSQAGVSVGEPHPGEGPQANRVAVLAEPRAAHWDAALGAGARVVVVAAHALGGQATVDAVLRGADAVVDAVSPPERLLEAVKVVGAGGSLLDPHEARALACAARARAAAGAVPPRLTGREQEIIVSIDRGDSVKQTAKALAISAKTVENLQGGLFRKLGVRNRAQAVSRAHALGVLESARQSLTPPRASALGDSEAMTSPPTTTPTSMWQRCRDESRE